MHALLPITALYVPAAHASQSPALAFEKPALQTQSKAASLPAGANEFVVHAEHVLSSIAPRASEYLPSVHREHGAEPFTSLYVPAVHAAHCIPSGPVYPLLQVQLVCIELPPSEYVCVGHSLHVDSEMAASNVLYLP